jgi:xeroderma pigmentosum group C-complementing protein
MDRNKASSAAERKIRMHTHLLHVQCLLYHGAIRNKWINDPELQVRYHFLEFI